jgi:hypothetical protein
MTDLWRQPNFFQDFYQKLHLIAFLWVQMGENVEKIAGTYYTAKSWLDLT